MKAGNVPHTACKYEVRGFRASYIQAPCFVPADVNAEAKPNCRK